MGNLRPVGSEKLQGMDKIKRILEISNYNLNIPQPINEDSSNEYKKVLADGNTYHIVKEKNGYVIKRGLYESTADYIEPMKNRKFYPSYSQALKRLNLITKEVNNNEGQIKNISLFESNDTQFVLSSEEIQEQGAPQPAAPQPAPQQQTPPPSTATSEEPEMDMPDMEEEPEMDMPDMEEEPDMDIPEEDEEEEKVTFKTIQKITGRLGQKIRDFLSDEENEMTSKDVKYVINSILSALDLDALDDEDKEEIMTKFEGGDEESEDMGDMEEPEMDMPDMEEEPDMDMPEDGTEQPKPEVGEMYHRGNMRERQKMQRMDNSISESKIDKVLGKYIHEQYKSKNNASSKISTLSESYIQELNSKKVLSKFPNSLFLGKTKNGNMAFEINEEVIYISPKGNVL